MEKIKLKKNVYISIARKTLSMIRYDLFIQATRTIKRFCWLRNSSFNERHTNWLTSLIRLLFFRFYSNISFENRFNIQIKSITRIVNEELKMDWYPGLNIYVEFPCRKKWNQIQLSNQICKENYWTNFHLFQKKMYRLVLSKLYEILCCLRVDSINIMK